MAILFKFSMYFFSSAFAGKIIYIQHVIFKYNRILEQASESYCETFINTANSFSLLF